MDTTDGLTLKKGGQDSQYHENSLTILFLAVLR